MTSSQSRGRREKLIRAMIKAFIALGNCQTARIDARVLSLIFTRKAKRMGIKL